MLLPDTVLKFVSNKNLIEDVVYSIFHDQTSIYLKHFLFPFFG